MAPKEAHQLPGLTDIDATLGRDHRCGISGLNVTLRFRSALKTTSSILNRRSRESEGASLLYSC